MSELSFNLSEIHPSDLPRYDSWQSAQNKVKSSQFCNELDIHSLNTALYQLMDNLTVPDKNHLLAAIFYLCGDLHMTGTPLNPRLYNADQWAYQLWRVEQEGIHTFADYIDKANSLKEDY